MANPIAANCQRVKYMLEVYSFCKMDGNGGLLRFKKLFKGNSEYTLILNLSLKLS